MTSESSFQSYGANYLLVRKEEHKLGKHTPSPRQIQMREHTLRTCITYLAMRKAGDFPWNHVSVLFVSQNNFILSGDLVSVRETALIRPKSNPHGSVCDCREVV